MGIGTILNLLLKAIKILFKLIIFTGVWIPVAVAYILERIVFAKFLGIDATPVNNLIAYNIVMNAFLISFIFPIIITIQNIIRSVLRIPDFNLLSCIFKGFGNHQKDKEPFKIPNELKTGKGIIFGKHGSTYISKPENLDGHVLVVGGAGSGKSSCIAIPTLLNWEGQVFAIDLKGELSETVKRYRPNMKIFNPSSSDTINYDPMKALNEGGNRVQTAQSIAKAIIPLPSDVKDPFWITSAQNLLTSALLHYCNELDFPKIMRKVQGTNIDELIKILSNSQDEDSKLFANPLSGLETKVTSGIFTEISNNIVTFATDTDLQNALKSSSNSISPSDLEKGHDIFIRIPEDKLDLWKNLLAVIVTQFLKSFERRADRNDKPILLILDEFARLGKIDGIMNALSTLRSKNVHIMILTQSLAQLDVIYNRDNRKVIADNCSYKVVLSATDVETQDYFSKLVGTHDVRKKSQSTNFDVTGINKGGGHTVAEQEKKIIKPEEFAYLKKPVLFTPYGFFRPKKAPYYEDKLFIERQKQQMYSEKKGDLNEYL